MKKRILFLSPFISPSRGGIQNLSYHLFSFLRKKEQVIGFSGNVVENEKFSGVNYTKNGKSQVKIAAEMFSSVLKTVIQDRKKDQLLFICMTWRLGLIAYVFYKLFRIPYIVYIHGNDIYASNKSKLEKYWIKKILNNADQVFANSQYTRTLGQTYGRNNIEVIHPGISYVEKTVQSRSGGRTLLTIARLEKRKGIDTTLHAVKQLVKKYKDLHYKIAGKGKDLERLQSLVKELNIDEHVTFLGFISEEEKERLYQEADLFVMPSYEVKEEGSVEGFGIVYLEANMYGKFVIGGKSGGVPDAIIDGQTGFLVDGTSPDEIADAIDRFFRDISQKDNYPEQCKKWANKHNWENIGEQLIELIETEKDKKGDAN